jgi:hypothetical protein
MLIIIRYTIIYRLKRNCVLCNTDTVSARLVRAICFSLFPRVVRENNVHDWAACRSRTLVLGYGVFRTMSDGFPTAGLNIRGRYPEDGPKTGD